MKILSVALAGVRSGRRGGACGSGRRPIRVKPVASSPRSVDTSLVARTEGIPPPLVVVASGVIINHVEIIITRYTVPLDAVVGRTGKYTDAKPVTGHDIPLEAIVVWAANHNAGRAITVDHVCSDDVAP